MAAIESPQTETAACLTSETIRSYLTGTIDDDSIQEIELHLAGCSTCERLSREIESQPDSFAASLNGLSVRTSESKDENGQAVLDAIKHLPVSLAGAKNSNTLGDSVGHLKSLGHYELIEPLGHGGMGVVYRPASSFGERMRDQDFAANFGATSRIVSSIRT